MKAMKQIVFVLLVPLILCLLHGCKDQPAGPNSVLTLSGAIESWSPSYGDTVYAIASGLFGQTNIAVTKLSAFGTFTFQQPLAAPPSYLLRPPALEPSDSTASYKVQDSLKFSNPGVRYIELHLALPNPLAATDPRFSKSVPLYSGNTLRLADSLFAVGDYRVQYFYFSETILITGQYAVTYYDPFLVKQMLRSSFVTDYSVAVSAGWSAITTRLVADDGRTCRYRVTAGDVGDKKWFIPFSASLSLPGVKSL